MAVFKYKAKNKDGKLVNGLVDAASETIAAEILGEKGLDIIKLVKQHSRQDQKISIPFLNRIKPKDIVVLSRQFAVLISAGVALVQSLHLLSEQTANFKLRKIVMEITEEVDGGTRLSESLQKRPDVFTGFYVNVVKSGETSGKLDEVLNYLADELEKDYDMNSKIKGAMIYPAFVMSGLIVVGIVMMVFVIPKLTDVMSETGAELPISTKILIAVSGFMASYWYLLIILLIGIIIAFKFITKIPFGKRAIDISILNIPIFGKLFRRIFLVRFTRSLQTLLIGGVNISKALGITADVVNNSVYKELIVRTKQEVEDGNSIASALIESKEMPMMVSQMISIGEETGRLDVILERITDFYTREINNMVANLMTLMEPIIMVVLGVGVGIMVAAIIMPMYNMASGF